MTNNRDFRQVDQPGEDTPCCPWCTALMAITVRKAQNGMMARYECPMCLSRAPAVCMDTAEECLVDAAKLVAKSWLTGIKNPTNGDKIRQLIATSDRQLAKVLRELDEAGDLAERINYCRELPECDEILARNEYVPSEKCLQCLAHWLGQPADEKVWGAIERGERISDVSVTD